MATETTTHGDSPLSDTPYLISLKKPHWQKSYRTGRDDLAADFYAPAMAESQMIQRTAGYFRSTVFALLYPQLSGFLARGGRMELLCSPYLSPVDTATLTALLEEESDGNAMDAALTDLSREAFLREIQALADAPYGRWHHSLLGGLLKYGFLDVRIALLRGGNGLFHEKLGIFHDAQGASLSFKGSVNETFSGWGLQGNIESLDVFCSWRDADAPRVVDHQRDFDDVWANRYASVQTLTLGDAVRAEAIQEAPNDPEEVQALLARYQRRRRRVGAGLLGGLHPNPPLEADAETGTTMIEPEAWPSGRVAEPHQREAIALWNEAGGQGIFAHATGSGKTFTSLHVIRHHLREGGVVLIVVPSTLLMKGWHAELTQEIPDATVMRVGGGHNQWRQPRALEMCLSYPSAERSLVILATMQTAATDSFWRRLKRPSNLLLVADEVHQLGSEHHLNLLNVNAGARLGLSATPERFGDPDGTAALMAYFNGVVGKPFTLADAMAAGRLTPYRYHPITVGLDAEEADDWESLTDQLRQAIQKGPRDSHGEPKDSSYTRLLKIKRSRIAKKARAKYAIPSKVLDAHYEPGQHWLVYCEDQAQMGEVARLIAKQGFPVWAYHSEMEGDPDATLAAYRAKGGVMVSIRCLDEGVDIPEISHAIILASSQNPRQFIQRRGRVLRRSPGKVRAEIWDALVMPPDMENDIHGSLTRSELLRALEFSDHAANQGGEVSHLRQIAADMGLSMDEIYGQANDTESDDQGDRGEG